MKVTVPAPALPDVRDFGAGEAMPSAMVLIMGLIAHVMRLLLTPGAIRSIHHLCDICLDIDAQIIRFMFAEARKLDPSLPELDANDYDLVWNADGSDFDIVHWSEATPATHAERMDGIRNYVFLGRLTRLIAMLKATRHAKRRNARRGLLSGARAVAHDGALDAGVALARAPP